MINRTNIPSPKDIRHQIMMFEKLSRDLSIQLAAEGKKMRDMLDLCQTFPNDSKYKQGYERHKRDRDDYQRQYESALHEINNLKTLLLFLKSRKPDRTE